MFTVKEEIGDGEGERIHPSIGDGVKEGEVAKGIQVQVLQFK